MSPWTLRRPAWMHRKPRSRAQQRKVNGTVKPFAPRGSVDGIEDRLRGVLARKFAVSEADLPREVRFAPDLGADSLDTVELILLIEDEFGIEVPDEDIATLTCLSAAVAEVRALLDTLQSAPTREPAAARSKAP
jgi:acyl carrier protein